MRIPHHTRQRDNDNRNKYEYVCITTYQPDTKSNPNPNPTTEKHAIVNIQLNIVTCPAYPDKFMRDNALGCNCHTAITQTTQA